MHANLVLLLIVLLVSCESKKAAQEQETTTDPDDGWITLFDGTSTEGWRVYNGTSLPANWVVEDGSLKSLGTGNNLGGDLVYGARTFDYFDLTFEWKISEGGNSGVFYHVVEDERSKGMMALKYTGFSVLTVKAIQEQLSLSFDYKIGPRRAGDPPALYADCQKIERELGFQLRHSDLQTIIKTAHAWHAAHPS